MRITKGKVVNGSIVVEGEPLDEGSIVTVLVSEERTFTLSGEEEAALLESIGEADRGELLDAGDRVEVLALWHSRRLKGPELKEPHNTPLQPSAEKRGG